MANLGLFAMSKASNTVILCFKIPYYTQWGQHILVCGSEPILGSWNVKKGLLLKPSHQGDELIWSGNLSVPAGFNGEYSYYVVDDEKNVLRWEAGKKRKLLLPNGVQNGQLVELRDLWQTGSDDLPLKSAFKNVIFRKNWKPEVERPLESVQNLIDHEGSVVVQFRICCPNVEKDTSIYAIGSPLKLGNWKIEDGLKLTYAGDSVWLAEAVIEKDDFPIKYRYCKYDKAKTFALETGANRELSVDFSVSQPKYIVLSDGLMREMPWRGAGVAIPMFSVRSEADVGVGEFLDLKLLVDWSVESGFHLVQLLPINDTSVHRMWWDSYPYSSLSVFALHPLYLRVQALSENISDDIKDVDYEATMAAKLSIAKKIFSQEKESVFSSVAYQKFFSENQMAKYFTAYRIDHILGFFRIWELPDHSMTGLCGKFRPSIPLSQEELEREGLWDFNRLSRPYINQLLLQEKFGASWTIIASTFLDEFQKGLYENVVLIRDPEDSKKFYPRFNLEDTSSFNDLDSHSKNVMKRLYYDYYFQRQENFWRQNALKTLPVLLNSSDMLACGEDLGMIPSCVHPVCAPSCHDCSTLRAWWEEDGERRRRFFKAVVGSDLLPPDRCTPEIAHFVLRQHVEAPSMWSIFPLQDLLALKEEYTTRPAVEETINDPTNPKHYWRYRVHVTIESLLKDKELTSVIKGLVHSSGRSCPPSQDDESLIEKPSSGDSVKLQAAKLKEDEKVPFASPLNGISKKEAVTVVA
ncbi:4-alpha-glucanotransferase dpe2 [Phtheirospermum japonicum]|uniref:4-alpha-glucanotransferase n=1 Tax=Phtheirospermum japonicum TaxID=374723 RepID=A0A830B9U4_9LAMI|nr:4-alpha-glucanotransferase dpe2 [Phtheirospermum japonicum]